MPRSLALSSGNGTHAIVSQAVAVSLTDTTPVPVLSLVLNGTNSTAPYALSFGPSTTDRTACTSLAAVPLGPLLVHLMCTLPITVGRNLHFSLYTLAGQLVATSADSFSFP